MDFELRDLLTEIADSLSILCRNSRDMKDDLSRITEFFDGEQKRIDESEEIKMMEEAERNSASQPTFIGGSYE